MENKTYSYHIFYFPFNWEISGDKGKTLSEQIDLSRIPIQPCSMWQRVQIDDCVATSDNTTELEELFGERQYYFKFVHPALYDIKGAENPLIHHYERREPQESNVEYRIALKEKNYILKVDAININLYSTGVGIMSFYLKNDREEQKEETHIRDINQYGRRIMPPHCGEFTPEYRSLIAQSISITGLEGPEENYIDTFDYAKERGGMAQRGLSNIWQPAHFISNLIKDLSPNLTVTPVIDDRMIVNCWYGNNKISEQIKNIETSEFDKSDFWYKYIFVDSGDAHNNVTCQNKEMKNELIKNSTYYRWQEQGTIYGVTRYSVTAVTDESWFASNVLAMHMRTIYSRMLELVIIQRASILRFSDEVTKVSALKGRNSKEIAMYAGSLYKEYIRFVNQIFFRNITSQDQGIELYEMMMRQFNSEVQIKELDEEISELHQYIMLNIEQRRSENGDFLNLLAAIFLPATLLTGIFGMNPIFREESLNIYDWTIQLSIIAIATIISIILLRHKRK